MHGIIFIDDGIAQDTNTQYRARILEFTRKFLLLLEMEYRDRSAESWSSHDRWIHYDLGHWEKGSSRAIGTCRRCRPWQREHAAGICQLPPSFIHIHSFLSHEAIININGMFIFIYTMIWYLQIMWNDQTLYLCNTHHHMQFCFCDNYKHLP